MPFGANNICNVNADNIQSGTFVGKRDIQKNKRQWIGNTANVNAGTIGGGNFIGKRQIANLMASHIQGATFSGQANAMDGSMKGMSAVCDPVTGKCVNMMGKRETSRVKRQWIGNTANVNAGTIGGGNFVGKRDIEKRQWTGNTANVNAGTIGGGNFIG